MLLRGGAKDTADSMQLGAMAASENQSNSLNTMLKECLHKSRKIKDAVSRVCTPREEWSSRNQEIVANGVAHVITQRDASVRSENLSSGTSARLAEKTNIYPLMTEYEDDKEIALALFHRLGEVVSAGSQHRQVIHREAVLKAAQVATDGEQRILLSIEAVLQVDFDDAKKAPTGDEIDGVASAGHTRDGLDTRRFVDFKTFFEAFRAAPRLRGQRVQWAAGLGLEGALAPLMPAGNAVDGLRGLRELDDGGVEALVLAASERMAAMLPVLIWKGIDRVRQASRANLTHREHGNGKFLADGLKVGEYATLEDFHRGPEFLIGAPNPRIFEGMEREHLRRENSDEKFVAPNYNVSTCPSQEWAIVVKPDRAVKYPHTPYDRAGWPQNVEWKGEHGRHVIGVDELLKLEAVAKEVERAKLLKEEVICLRLYTGPMFMLYNAALRGLPEADVELLKGNRYKSDCPIS